MFSLPVLSVPGSVSPEQADAKFPEIPVPRDSGEGLFNRSRVVELTNRVLRARTLRGAARILRKAAKELPPTIVKKGEKTGRPGMGWREHLLKLADGLLRGEPAYSLFKEEGNEKLPFVTFSELPLWTCPGRGECAEFCYSLTAWRYPGGYCRQLQATLYMTHRRDMIADAFMGLDEGITLRLYVDGDFRSTETLRFWMNLLHRRPDIKAYGYSKSWTEFVALDEAGYVWPANYFLNLSSGGNERGVSRSRMSRLPIVRGDFISVETDYRPLNPETGKPKTGNIGFERYADKAYHRKVREAANEAGFTKVFSCPGRCGDCAGGSHACGNPKFRDIVIVNGVH